MSVLLGALKDSREEDVSSSTVVSYVMQKMKTSNCSPSLQSFYLSLPLRQCSVSSPGGRQSLSKIFEKCIFGKLQAYEFLRNTV